MTSLRIPFMDEIEEQIGSVVDRARAEELTKWIEWVESKRDKARVAAFEAVAHELRAARERINDALTAQA